MGLIMGLVMGPNFGGVLPALILSIMLILSKLPLFSFSPERIFDPAFALRAMAGTAGFTGWVIFFV